MAASTRRPRGFARHGSRRARPCPLPGIPRPQPARSPRCSPAVRNEGCFFQHHRQFSAQAGRRGVTLRAGSQPPAAAPKGEPGGRAGWAAPTALCRDQNHSPPARLAPRRATSCFGNADSFPELLRL